MLHPDADFDVDLANVPALPSSARIANFSVVMRTPASFILRKDPALGSACGLALLGLLCASISVVMLAIHGSFGWVGSLLVASPFAWLASLCFRRGWKHVKPVTLAIDDALRIRHVRLTSIIWRADRGNATTARARIELVVDGETTLEGPETAELPVTEWHAARDALLPFALEVCRRTHAPLELVCRGFQSDDGARLLNPRN